MHLRKLLISLALCLCLIVVVFAHSGRTDSNGGHTDHSTGEYHYHHGYPAHQHSDLDGDGDLDCPYNFVDKTNSSIKETKSFDEQLEEELEKLRKEKATSKKPTKPSVKVESSTKPQTSEKSATFLGSVLEALSFLWNIICFMFEIFLGLGCVVVVTEVIKKIFRR